MAETVRLRNTSGVDLHVAVLNNRLVAADETVEIPARLIEHQMACTGIDREYVPAEGTWRERDCPGCLTWPQETWRVQATKAKSSTEKGE